MNKIKLCRTNAGLTQDELAKEMGCKQQAVANWETGRSHPRFTMIPKLAMVLGCSVEDLLQDAN